MKKAGRILSLVVILVVLSTALCFATSEDNTAETSGVTSDKFTLLDTYPKDGAKGASVENMSVKLYFNTELTEEVLGDKNANAIQIYDPDNEKLPTRVLYSRKEKGVVLVIVDTDSDGKMITGQSNAEYTVKISADLVDNNGNTLGEDKVIKYTTLNQSTNNTVSMIMMFGMMGAIMVITTRGAKKEAEKQAQQRQKDAKVNPYKEAKKTGKSVEEIVEKDQKNKAKQAQKAAKKAAKEAEEDDDYDDDYVEDGVYKVKGPRPIAAAGGKYITGRKAEAEARKAAEEQRKAQEAKWAANAKKGKGKKK